MLLPFPVARASSPVTVGALLAAPPAAVPMSLLIRLALWLALRVLHGLALVLAREFGVASQSCQNGFEGKKGKGAVSGPACTKLHLEVLDYDP